jgi:hypothetical protein
MDIQPIAKVVASTPSAPGEIGFPPEDIDPDALKILHEAGFVWDSRLIAFRKIATDQPGSTATIDCWFLRDQKLVVNTTLGTSDRFGQLQRLRILVQSMD